MLLYIWLAVIAYAIFTHMESHPAAVAQLIERLFDTQKFLGTIPAVPYRDCGLQGLFSVTLGSTGMVHIKYAEDD